MDQNPQRPITEHEPRDAPLTGEVLEPGYQHEDPGGNAGAPFDDRRGAGGWLFGPRSFAGGRVQVYGCSPGCIVLSLIVSLILSILLTWILNAIF